MQMPERPFADRPYAELTLDELALALAPAIADGAIFDGWGDLAVTSAADMEGVDPAVARLAYPGGAMDMIAAWIAAIDLQMAQAWPTKTLALKPVRERIRTLVAFRLEAATGREEALRRALAVMAMPQNAARALRTGWSSADRMWRLAGDTATDLNHYSKRATLAALYGATLVAFVQDDTVDKAETHAFLDRRIDGVMRFERVKRQLLRMPEDRFSVARVLGRLRYPAR